VSNLENRKLIFPTGSSCQVQKNGIKLSWDLACTLGYPSLGQSLFINPLNTSEAQKETDDVDILRAVKCKNIFLALVPPKIGPSSGIQPVFDCHSARNGVITELSKKITSTPVRRKDESHDFVSKNGSSLCLDPTTASSALADEKINELLQTFALWWLSGRQLLKGNYVPLSMCGKVSLFVVIGAESEAVDVLYNKSCTVNNVETSSEIGEAPVLFLVDRTTKVHLSSSVSSEKLGLDRPGLPSESSVVAGKENEDSNRPPMLGGLSKESAAIKEIISFSLADQIDVPRYIHPPSLQYLSTILILSVSNLSIFSVTKVFFFMAHLEQGKHLLLPYVSMMQEPTFLQSMDQRS
jgi:hypothetical protein